MGETARSVCAAAPLIPIIADADTGGGNALNVQRTVQDLIAAGAAGCFFERNMMQKIASARDVIGDSDFFLVARTDARANSAKSEAIAHANLYMEAGADACFVEAPWDDDELKEWQELKEMGVHLIVHPLTTLYASACALIDVLKVLKDEGTTRDQLCKLATFEEFNELIGLESWFELEARYSKFKSPVGAEL